MCIIAPVERPRIDPGRIEALCEDIGPYATEDLVCRSMELIAEQLCLVHEHSMTGAHDQMREALSSLISTADHIGLTTLARIGRDVSNCLDDADLVAEAAVLARLARNGERSLAALWDLQGVSI